MSDLREELHRLAERAPVAEVPRDTWRRARRSRRRDGLLVLGAVLVVAGLLLAPWGALPDLSRPPVADSAGGGAVPSYVWGVPERMEARAVDDSWAQDEVVDPVRSPVGAGAVAFVTSGGLPVVIGAADGAYHLLDLPDFTGNTFTGAVGLHAPVVALSPDGRRLAYGYAVFGPDSDNEPIPSGVRVLDLETGDVREVPVPGGEGTYVTTIGWSPDGRWLVWSGFRMGSWTKLSMSSDEVVAGRVAPGATSSESLPAGRSEDPVMAVADDGAVALVVDGSLVRWDGRVIDRRRFVGGGARALANGVPSGSGAAVSPDGLRLAVGEARGAANAWVVDLATARATRRPYPDGVVAAPVDTRPVGWLSDDLLVATVAPTDAPDDRRLVVMTRERSATSTYRMVGTLDRTAPARLSVAVDLMSLDHPTVARPEPDWPWSTERWVLTIGLGALAALALALWGARLRQRWVSHRSVRQDGG